MTTYNSTKYEITNLNDTCGLPGTFETPEEAVAYINDSYERAKKQGYENSEAKWLVVSQRWERVLDDRGVFHHETRIRQVYFQVELNHATGRFEFVI